MANDYRQFRGRCKELVEAAISEDPTLTAVRGHYFCPIWNSNEPHWWAVAPDGTIVDPSARQFPSNGMGIYEPFSGLVECAQCGNEIKEDEADIHGNYAFCSGWCHGRFVGVF